MKTKLLFLAVVLLTMLSTRAVAQDDASAMREQMKERLDELKALVPDGVKGLNETLKHDTVKVYIARYTEWYNASKSYEEYEEAYGFLGYIIDRVNEYLAAYREFTDNMAKLQTLINNFNADTEYKQGYKTFAQNVYNAYTALSAHDMIAITDENVEAQKEYDDNEYNYVPDDVTSENIADVEGRPSEYISTYGQFNAFFSQNTKELGSIYLEVAGTATAESPENLTAQLRNPNLENAGEQWWGTEWTSIGNSAAEQSGKPFVTYQQVHLPPGYYTLVGYGMDRRGSWADVLANDEGWNKNHRTYLFSHLDSDGSDSTMVDAFKAKNMALTADITEGAGNISTCEVDGVTYYTPNDMAQYRAWEDAKIAMAGQGHGAVVQFWVWQDEGDFGSLGFAHPWHADNTWFVADGIQLYYAKDGYPDINIDTPDCASVTITNDGWATFYTDKALAFSGIKGLTAYTAKRDGSTVTLTPVDNVPANTGVVLKGDAKTYNIPIIASSTTDKGELQGSATTATAFDAHATVGGIYVLGLNDKNEAQFEKKTSDNVPAGKPYLLVPTAEEPSSPLRVVIAGETTKYEYDLTLADGSDAHGTVAFTVGGASATQAKKDDVVTVTVTPNEGYSAKDVTVRAYTTWEAANAPRRTAPVLQGTIATTKQENGTWTFTMPEANVWVVVTYTKHLQDAWIQAIADQTYTGEAITPTVTVKDGETTLTLNTDYTVAYSNNVNTGTATVTVTGTGNYSGTATANFTIVADKSALNTAITEAEAYYNSIKDSNPDAAAALQTAINTAKTMQEKGDAAQEEVNSALSALTTAKTTAEQTVLTETKTALNTDITAAETYYNSIKDSNPAAANTLKEAIDAAKGVKDNANATQEQVDAAIAALAGAKTTAEQTVLTETKTALNDDITEAEAYYNSIKDSNPAAAATLLEAINTAKAAKDNGDATQEQVDAAIAALASAKTTAEQTVLTETKTALNTAITAAETYYNSIKDSNPEAAATLLEAINTAKAAKDNGDATQEQVDAAIAALAGAKTTAEQTVLTETKTALNTAITEAEAYYNSIKDSNPEAAATLLEAINTAKAAKDNGDATQEQVDAAIAALSTAINTAKVEVSHITLTIPAKSYMARIDGDKRQIETAVAGVKLYSVKSVTNTEVELTNELSVIAAEMPFFIYNDNDTEVEVSIVVSSEDADNVEYDSEHFKGTLVDKTFTDEDMKAADHYVLTGHNFVWVKDAGTLAAGKCWIELVPSSAAHAHARALSIVHDGETTGISTVKTAADTKDAAVYDLQGRRVMQPTKGLFIVNGKKVVIK